MQDATLTRLEAEAARIGQALEKLQEKVLEGDRQHLASRAAALYEARRRRDRIFGDLKIFGEPAWDILLDLVRAEAEGREISVSSATIAAAVPLTTGLRWISTLVEMGLVERVPDDFDRRRCYVRLTDRCRDLLDQVLTC